jgi:hypothetical protein
VDGRGEGGGGGRMGLSRRYRRRWRESPSSCIRCWRPPPPPQVTVASAPSPPANCCPLRVTAACAWAVEGARVHVPTRPTAVRAQCGEHASVSRPVWRPFARAVCAARVSCEPGLRPSAPVDIKRVKASWRRTSTGTADIGGALPPAQHPALTPPPPLTQAASSGHLSRRAFSDFHNTHPRQARVLHEAPPPPPHTPTTSVSAVGARGADYVLRCSRDED